MRHRHLSIIPTAAALILAGLTGLPRAEAVSLTNVALESAGGIATQTSTRVGSGGNLARFAIDGNTDGVFLNGSVTHTLDQTNTSWMVELPDSKFIDSVRLFNRTDCCGVRLSNFRLSVLDETMNEVFGQNVVGPVGANQLFPVPGLTEGKFVKIEITGHSTGFNGLNLDPSVTGDGVLSLAEVQVQGADLANVARNPFAVASQSSTRVGGGGNAASFAIDGNTDGVFNNGSVTHTAGTEQNAFWQVDLGDRFALENVILFNRADCCGDRLSNFRLSVFDGAAEVFGQNFFVGAGNVPQGGSFDIPLAVKGDLLRVQLLGTNNASNGPLVLSLAEVQVFGAALQVPEPATALMALLAMGGLAGRTRRRRLA